MRRLYPIILLLLAVLVVAVLAAQVAAEPEMAIQAYFPVVTIGHCVKVPPDNCPWCVPERCYWVSW